MEISHFLISFEMSRLLHAAKLEDFVLFTEHFKAFFGSAATAHVSMLQKSMCLELDATC